VRKVTISVEDWPTKQSFTITGHTFTEAKVLVVTLEQDGVIGRGEGTGIYYLNETVDDLFTQANRVVGELESGLSRQSLQMRLPRSGARNAIDCALWDLETKLSNKTIWQLTGVEPTEVVTVNTIGIDTPEAMAKQALSLDTPKIKVKLDGQNVIERLEAIRKARPEAEIVVDANQGWTFEQLMALAPVCKAMGITMIEQPLPRGEDSALEHYVAPLPLCADESCLDTTELEQASRRYQMINIKLDKTGGLTEALKLARQAHEKGLGLMVGNMLGSSLAMAPAFVIAPLCQLADLDGPILLQGDRESAMDFTGGIVTMPHPGLWG